MAPEGPLTYRVKNARGSSHRSFFIVAKAATVTAVAGSLTRSVHLPTM